MANITLDLVETQNQFNFRHIYELTDDDIDENNDSPFTNLQYDCNYYEPCDALIKLSSFKPDDISSYFHINCRSLSANWGRFCELLSEVSNDSFNFDFIGISEIFNCDRDDRLSLSGYHPLISQTRKDDGRGGVGIFIKDHIHYSIRHDLSVFIPHVYESLFIEIISNKSKEANKILGVIYRPNSLPRADIDIFSSTLIDTIDIIDNEKKQCTLMGDMNIDILKYNTHDKTNSFIDNIMARSFMPKILKPTRISQTSATLIDHIYTNDNFPLSISGIIINDVADHFGVFHIQNNITRHSPLIIKPTRIYSENNISKFINLLQQTDFTDILQTDCPEVSYQKFIRLYSLAHESAFPLKVIHKNKKYIKKEAWMSAGLMTSMRTRIKLYAKKLRKPTEHNIDRYKSYNNQYNKLKRLMKMTYYKNLIEENRHNIKRTWSILNETINKHGKKSNFPQSFLIDNKEESNNSNIVNAFNAFYSRIGKTTAENVPTGHRLYTEFLTNPSVNSIFIEPVEPFHVLEIINKLKPKTSTGHDGIPMKIVKLTANFILGPLTHIINKSLSTGIVPKDLKIAKVIPIYKAADNRLLQNYRPISLLPAFSKIYEKIVFNKILSYMGSTNLFYKHQYGFRPKHSTIHPIVHLLNQCAENNNSLPKKIYNGNPM